jgi:hypothetical protein
MSRRNSVQQELFKRNGNPPASRKIRQNKTGGDVFDFTPATIPGWEPIAPKRRLSIGGGA